MTKRDEFLNKAAALADLAFITGGLLAVCTFGYFFYFYTFTTQREFSNDGYLVVYYGLPLAVAIVLFASLRLQPIHKINGMLLLVASCASVYGFELFTEWQLSSLYAPTRPVMTLLGDSTDKQKEAAALEKQWGVRIDTRPPDEVLASMRTGTADPVAIITPSNHLFLKQPDGRITSSISLGGEEVMPLAAISNRDTLLCNESGQWVHYRSDRHGFSNPDDVWDLNGLDIGAIGDSFAQGYCVPADRSFVAQIRQRYPATLNLGVAGDGPLLMLATLEEYLPQFRPKVVLWFYFEGNDLGELQNELNSEVLSRYLRGGFTQAALQQQQKIDQALIDQTPRLKALDETRRANRLRRHPLTWLMDSAKLSALRNRLGLIGGVNESELAPVNGRNMDAFRRVLSQGQAQVRGWGGELVFVYLPDWARYAGYHPPAAEKRNDVLTVARDLGMPIVDIDRAFESQSDPLALFPFRKAGHYNELGHRVVAEELLKTLSGNAQLHQLLKTPRPAVHQPDVALGLAGSGPAVAR